MRPTPYTLHDLQPYGPFSVMSVPLAKQAQGDRTGAIQDLQQAIAVEQPGEVRGSALARTLLGQRHAEQGNLSTARMLYQEALAIVPGYPQALLDLADLEHQQGNYRKAERLYAQVDDPLALLGLARGKSRPRQNRRSPSPMGRSRSHFARKGQRKSVRPWA